MSRFYAEIKGNKGMSSRQGTPQSGMWGHIRGWNVGVEIECYVDKDNKDVCTVYQTGGSNNPSNKTSLVIVTEGGAKQTRLP